MKPPPAQAAALLGSPDDIEAQFYEALQQGDVDRVMAVWSDDDEVVCVHPGGVRVVGQRAIRASFEAIFSKGAIPAQPEGVRRLQTEDSAIHTVFERVEVTGPKGLQTAWVIATNVYVKTALGWRMAAHHASPGSAQDLPDMGHPPALLH
jgi:uncharacterized protein (TIGR02246 family)